MVDKEELKTFLQGKRDAIVLFCPNSVAMIISALLMPKVIETFPVVSSNIDRIGRDSVSETLEVIFKGGGAYRYLGVNNFDYNLFMEAPSKGRALQMIKAKYPFIKMTKELAEKCL